AFASLTASVLDKHRPEMALVNQKLLGVISPTIDMATTTGSLGFSSSSLGLAQSLGTSSLFTSEKSILSTASILGRHVPAMAMMTTAVQQMVPKVDTTAFASLTASVLDKHRPEMALVNQKLLGVISPTIDMATTTGSLGFSSSTLDLARSLGTSSLFMTENKSMLSSAGVLGQHIPAMAMMTTAVQQMVPKIGLASLGHLTRVTDAFTMALGLPDAFGSIRLPVVRELDRITDSLQASVIALLGRWIRLGDLGHFLAKAGYGAALSARDAALQGNREAVGQFARVWLGVRKVTAAVIDAVIGALFDPSWEQGEVELTLDNLNRLRRRETKREASLLGSKAKGGDLRVRSVDFGEGEFPFAVEPLWAPRPDPNMVRLEGFDPRVERVLAQLSAAEREVALAWATDSSSTWGEAAVECGHGPEKGESVRRKLGRLGKQLRIRQLAA
ncbi:hypothetical protein, partial [Nocardia salmonicida]